MDKIRLGKDIILSGQLEVGGIVRDLANLDLCAVATNKSTMVEYPCEFVKLQGDENKGRFKITLRGYQGAGNTELTTGKYIVSIWQNRNKNDEAVWDIQAFQLVQWTFKETDLEDDDLEVMALNIGTVEVTNQVIMAAQEAASAANAAASAANTAATNATNAVSMAETALSDISDIITNANDSIDQAVALANNAAELATNAANVANQATQALYGKSGEFVLSTSIGILDGEIVAFGTENAEGASVPMYVNAGDKVGVHSDEVVYFTESNEVGTELETIEFTNTTNGKEFVASKSGYIIAENPVSADYTILYSDSVLERANDTSNRTNVLLAELQEEKEQFDADIAKALSDAEQAKSEASTAAANANTATAATLIAKEEAEESSEAANALIKDIDTKFGSKSVSGYSRQGFNYSGCNISGLNIGIGTTFYVRITNNSSKRFTLVCNTDGDNNGSQSVQVVSMSGFFGITANRVVNSIYLSLNGSYTSNESITLDIRYNLSGEIQEAVTNANSAAEAARTRAASAESAAVLANRAADRFGKYDADALDQMVEDINTFKATGVYAEDLNEEDYVPQEWSAEDIAYSDSATYPEGTVGYKLKLLTESSASLEIGEDGYISID